MAQKKQLSKNRKRKAIIRKANPGLFPIKANHKTSYIPPFYLDECMVDIAERIQNLIVRSQPKPVQEHMFANINIKDDEIAAANEFYKNHLKNSFQPKY